MNAASTQTSQQAMPDPIEPSQRSTGASAEPMNKVWNSPPRRSRILRWIKKFRPAILGYYYRRSTGEVAEIPYEAWEGVDEMEAYNRKRIEANKVQHTFFEMDYSHGFTGRGVLPEALERPCLVGPRNETVEDRVGLFPDSGYERVDRPLWKAIDAEKAAGEGKSRHNEDVGPLGESRDDKDVGPFGESRDDEEVGPFGESRDEGDNIPQGQEDDEEDQEEDQEEEEEEDDGKGEKKEEEDDKEEDDEKDEDEEDEEEEEDKNELTQLDGSPVAMVSGPVANTGDASSSQATTLPTKPQESLTPSSLSFTLTPSTPSKKRARSSEDDAEDEESQSRQKRMRTDGILGIVRRQPSARRRMDAVLGIVRKDTNAPKVPQKAEAAMTPETQQSRKRGRSLDDDSEDGETEPTPKRPRLHEQIQELVDDGEEYITAGQANVAKNDDSMPVDQDTSSSEGQEAIMLNKAPINTETNEQASAEAEPSTNGEAKECEHASADDEAAPAETKWDTAHGINSHGANIRVHGRGTHDITGKWTHLLLPRSTGLPDRDWTEQEKEDLRVYIQDCGVEDWALLARSTNRPEAELQYMYSEVVTARNKAAGRPECDGIPKEYPDTGT